MRIGTFQYQRERGQRWVGLRVLAMRHFPMFVTKREGRRYFDGWLKTLSPSVKLRKAYASGKINRATFVRRYRKEMGMPEAKQAIRILADLSAKVPISVGCGCDTEDACHRQILRDLIRKEASRGT